MTSLNALYGACAIGFVLGAMVGSIPFHVYRRTLLACAQQGTCESLPDGRFYRIIPETEANRLESLDLASRDADP
jgi:hypothetical protein